MLSNLPKDMLLDSPEARLISIYLNSFDKCLYEMTTHVSRYVYVYGNIYIYTRVCGWMCGIRIWVTYESMSKHVFKCSIKRKETNFRTKWYQRSLPNHTHDYVCQFVFLYFQRISTPRCVSRWMIATTNHVTPTSL